MRVLGRRAQPARWMTISGMGRWERWAVMICGSTALCAGPIAAGLMSRRRSSRRLLTLIAQGLSNPEIAIELHLSEGTVKTHVGRILAKLELRDRVHAVILAYECGLV
jgi:DNA-binding NarL/FixJ family response regulator